ncbi:MAG TPA: hypothetical protein VEJ42_05090 [Streptosporangiaceae bacterium]|nr:hypothetical protein [Streptosporangiaceae bacterium]
MDFRRFLMAARQHKLVVVVAALVGLGLAIGYTVLAPPMLASRALVELQLPGGSGVDPIQTQVLLGASEPVLSAAGQAVVPAASLTEMERRVTVSSLTPNVLAITGHATTANRAEALANAVAASYLAYIKAHHAASGVVGGQVVEAATTATGSLSRTRAEYAGFGLLIGLLVGIVTALGLSRADKRLRRRDDIARAIGVPVVAAIPVRRPSDAIGWARLFESYEPTAVDAWALRRAFRQLGLPDHQVSGKADTSLTVISLSNDRGALSLGPQVAAFAASLGIQTTLLVGPELNQGVSATLAAACGRTAAASAERPFSTRVAAGADRRPDAAFTVIVTVADSRDPQVRLARRTTATVLAVSTGAVTAEQLARVAVSAASDGRDISGIIVADPDPTDPTTGRLPDQERPVQRRMPTRVTGFTELG